MQIYLYLMVLEFFDILEMIIYRHSVTLLVN
jgi:hypothetical protein